MSTGIVDFLMFSWTRPGQSNAEAVFCIGGSRDQWGVRFLGYSGNDSGLHGLAYLQQERRDDTDVLILNLNFNWKGSAALQTNPRSNVQIEFPDGLEHPGNGFDHSSRMISARLLGKGCLPTDKFENMVRCMGGALRSSKNIAPNVLHAIVTRHVGSGECAELWTVC